MARRTRRTRKAVRRWLSRLPASLAEEALKALVTVLVSAAVGYWLGR